MDNQFLSQLIKQIFENSPSELASFQTEQHSYGQSLLGVEAYALYLKTNHGLDHLPCFDDGISHYLTPYLETVYLQLSPNKRQNFLQTPVWMPDPMNLERRGLKSYARFPLYMDGDVVGCAALASQHMEWQAEDQTIAQILVRMMEIRLENWRLKYQEQYQGGLLESIQKMTLLINDLSTPLEHILQQTLAESLRLTGAGGAQIHLFEGSRYLRVAAEIGEMQAFKGYRDRLEIGQGLIGAVAKEARLIFVEDYQQSPYVLPHVANYPIGSVIAVPILKNKQVLGVLGVYELGKKPLVASQQFILEQLGALAGLAISQAQLHQALEHEHKQLRAILDYSTVPIFLYDARWRLVLANPEAYAVIGKLGLDLGKYVGKSLNRMFNDFPPQVSFPRDANFNELIEVSLAEAGDFFVQMVPIRPNKGTGFVVVGQSVSAERDLHQARRDLLHVLSHDIGNILSLALGYTSLMIDQMPPPDEYDAFIRRIFEALNRGRSLIRDVVALEYAKTQGQQILKPYKLDDLVEQVVTDTRSMAEFYHHQLGYTLLAKPEQNMVGNIPLLKQCLENIINNAIKYTPQGGKIEVILTLDGDYGVIQVKDNGLGIPEKDLTKIWERFYRVDTTETRGISGTGLGLNLVDSVIKAHGGRVQVESQVGKGSLFSLYLPIGFNPAEYSENPRPLAAS